MMTIFLKLLSETPSMIHVCQYMNMNKTMNTVRQLHYPRKQRFGTICFDFILRNKFNPILFNTTG